MSSQSPKVVTRFAPSPTGFLHIGGARTALFNWLLARSTGGTFLLRIEDTDKERSTQDAVEAIFDGLNWLGLGGDEEPVYQSDNAARHAEVAQDLLASGKAYKCFAKPEENTAAREAARAVGKNFLGDLWRDRDCSDMGEDKPYVVRMKMPREGETTVHDLVQGAVTVPNKILDDLVILRADGTPTYMLSVVVDDHDMGVTHVVRGDDHLNNTFKQVQIYKAMGWDLPAFGHIPLIHGADGKKLSKRHGALGVDAYRDMGLLAEAVNNYLLRLGWSFGDEEQISAETAIANFAIEDVNKGAARFDFDKLDSLNALYLRALDVNTLIEAVAPFLAAALRRELDSEERTRLAQGLPTLVERAKRLTDLADMATFFCNTRPLKLTDKAQKAVNEQALKILPVIADALEQLQDYSQEAIKERLTSVAADFDLGLGKVMQPLRAVLTGGKPSGDLAEIVEILGKNESVGRIRDQVDG